MRATTHTAGSPAIPSPQWLAALRFICGRKHPSFQPHQ